MALSDGTRLGFYEILAAIGSGGMGEVYRAKDTKLEREVAIKVLREEFSKDREKLARFEREAKLLAQLNHPNIATLHGLEEWDGQKFLVMELVEGETLAERIAAGRIAADEVLLLFKQIALGLEAAHEKGVVHRDLKPANIMIGPDGAPKILDFGLAKAFTDDDESSVGSSEFPTLTKGTALGTILGTASYMSPEQARGKAVDKRTDIWAFGCCLFETLTAKRAFAGATVSDTIVRILEHDPDWDALPDATPVQIRELLDRCLSKERRDRLHDIGDARIEVARYLEGPRTRTATDVGSNGRSSAKRWVTALAATAVALGIGAIGGIGGWMVARFEPNVTEWVTRSVIPLEPNQPLAVTNLGSSIAISPDGGTIAYVVGLDGARRLFLRSVSDLNADPVEGSEGAVTPFFSPDSKWVGFTTGGRRLMRASVGGGAPQVIADVDTFPRGVSWSEAAIVFAQESSTPLTRLNDDGTEVVQLTALNGEHREKSHRYPRILPGGKAALFVIARSTTESWDNAAIAVVSLETGEYHVVLEGGSEPRYSRSGHLVYAHSGDLLAVPFDVNTLEVTGQPVRVVEGIMTSPIGGGAQFDLSENGMLVYAAGQSRTEARRVVWVDRQGRAEPLMDLTAPFTAPRLSPDGRFLAVQIQGGNETVWIYDLSRSALSRLTPEWDNMLPVWSPDGTEIILSSARGDMWNLYRQPVDVVEAQRLTETPNLTVPLSWSPDGRSLAFRDGGLTGPDIWLLSLEDGRTTPFLQTPADEGWAAFSPDGRWIAYESDESGRFEIYLRRFPDATGRQLVSTSGGRKPVWNPNGGELFYRDGDKMISVEVRSEGELTLGTPTVLYERPYARSLFPTFTVTPDGQRFVDIDDSEAEHPPTQLILVQNFDDELERLVPTF